MSAGSEGLRDVLDLVVPSVFVQQRYDGLDVSFLDDVQSFRTFHQNTVKNL